MLEDAAKKYGDVPYIAMEDGREVGFSVIILIRIQKKACLNLL